MRVMALPEEMRPEVPAGRDAVSGWGGTGGDVRRAPFSWNALLWSMVCPRRGHRLLPTVSGTLLIAVGLALVTGLWSDFVSWVRDAFVSDVRLPI